MHEIKENASQKQSKSKLGPGSCCIYRFTFGVHLYVCKLQKYIDGDIFSEAIFIEHLGKFCKCVPELWKATSDDNQTISAPSHT